MARDIIEAAKVLKDASAGEIQTIALHDWNMIREVAANAFAYAPRPKADRRHHGECELRGMDWCPCEQGREDAYYQE